MKFNELAKHRRSDWRRPHDPRHRRTRTRNMLDWCFRLRNCPQQMETEKRCWFAVDSLRKLAPASFPAMEEPATFSTFLLRSLVANRASNVWRILLFIHLAFLIAGVEQFVRLMAHGFTEEVLVDFGDHRVVV